MPNILLVAIQSNEPSMQLAPYLIKGYFEQHSRLSGGSNVSTDIEVIPFELCAEQIADVILEKRPNVLGISCYMWNIVKAIKTIELVKAADTSITTVFGGPEASPRANELLNRYKALDFVVRDEGEATFTALIESLVENPQAIHQVEGIAFRQGNKACSTPARPNIEDLDAIPSPYLDELITEPLDLNRPVTETMRGCPFQCSYCYYFKGFDHVRTHSLERVEKELRWILSRNPKSVYLMDPTFNHKPKRAKEILKLVRKYNNGTSLNLELRAELLDEEMAELLKQANANFIEIGIQSTNPATLRHIKRTLDKKKVAENIGLLQKHGVNGIQLHLIDALPGETIEDFKQSLDWVYSLKPSSITMMCLSGLPGTYLRESASELGLEFEATPPYRALRSDAMSPSDLEQIIAFRISLDYLQTFWRNTLHQLTEVLGVGVSKILLEWRRSTLTDNISENDRGMRVIQWIEFVDRVLKRYGDNTSFDKIREIMFAEINKHLTAGDGANQTLSRPQENKEEKTEGPRRVIDWDGWYTLRSRDVAISACGGHDLFLRVGNYSNRLRVNKHILDILLHFSAPITPRVVLKRLTEENEIALDESDLRKALQSFLDAGILRGVSDNTRFTKKEHVAFCVIDETLFCCAEGSPLQCFTGEEASFLLRVFRSAITLTELTERFKVQTDSAIANLARAIECGIVIIES